MKAIAAAEAVDGYVCMSPTEGADANDVHRREGPGAVKTVLASAKPVGEANGAARGPGHPLCFGGNGR